MAYYGRLPRPRTPDLYAEIRQHLEAGQGVRRTARLCRVHESVVQEYCRWENIPIAHGKRTAFLTSPIEQLDPAREYDPNDLQARGRMLQLAKQLRDAGKRSA